MTELPTTATEPEQLAGFLRNRRAAVSPEEIDVPTYGRRRVPGLRREELAEAAGVSLTYYTRLEQGLASTPSSQVLDARAVWRGRAWEHRPRLRPGRPHLPRSAR